MDSERLDAQLPPDLIPEDGRVLATDEAELIARSHVVVPEGEYAELPRVQAAGVDPETGERLAITDPRSGEQPLSVRVPLPSCPIPTVPPRRKAAGSKVWAPFPS